jgi:acetolactate synthase-1/2/3 large subunit
MNGAESLIATLAAGGVDTCFANPGTSEIHLVAALDREVRIRCILTLFEGVVSGAADGYARMAGKPACTLLHLGPGFANSLANLHNAYRAQVPIINLIGQHATHHLRHDTPLTSDIEALARQYSGWLRTSSSSAKLGRDTAESIVAACTAPGRIATLIVPADAAWTEGGMVSVVPSVPRAPASTVEVIHRAAAMLRTGLPTAVLLAGNALYGKGLAAAGRIAAATNSKLFAPYPFTRLERGAGAPPVERIHYILEQAVAQFQEFEQLILVGARPPVAYFAYPGKDSAVLPPKCKIHQLASADQDSVAALGALAAELAVDRAPLAGVNASRPPVPTGNISLAGLATAIAAVLPENAIVVDESMTSGRALLSATAGCPRHDWLANTGGSIGIALPLAVGAAVACPERRVLCLSADGSGMYTLQALWTMARESLNVTTVVYSNREYAVLKREFAGLGIGEPGPRAASLFEIGHPDLDWTRLARGMGVPATRVADLDEFAVALKEGLGGEGPRLIEVKV